MSPVSDICFQIEPFVVRVTMPTGGNIKTALCR